MQKKLVDYQHLASQMTVFRWDVLAVTVVIHLLALALPLALLHIYDRILPGKSYGTVAVLVAGVAAAVVLELMLRYGRTRLFVTFGARYEAKTITRMLNHLLEVDVAEVEKRGGSYVSETLRAVSQMRDFWSGQAGVSLYEVPFAVIYLLLIWHIGGWLVIFPLILFCCALPATLQINKGIEQSSEKVEAFDRERKDFAWSIFAGLLRIKSLGAEGRINQLYRSMNDNYMAAQAKLEGKLGFLRENNATISNLSTVLVVAFGAGMVMDGRLTTGALSACTMLAGRSIGPTMAGLGYFSQLARTAEAQAKIDELFALPLSPAFALTDTGPEAALRTFGDGRLCIDMPAWSKKQVVIEPGELVLLNTEESSDASKLLSKIAGLAQDEEITITIDGHRIAAYGHQAYRDSVMLVTRHLALVPGSILNNLTLYDPRYNEEAERYCELLGLQPYLNRLRHGILTEVGPATAEHLDEGVYQRIALIRALVRRPKILLLDHAASGMDIDGIKRFAALLQELRGATTVIMATYREPLQEVCTRSVQIGKRGELA
ncbi:MAG: ABC transporter transmembrane domain-containing protein [Trichlorobacter sp.]|uniref:ABC transporter transmembrane domain-containing protein n=1 Tax=Trichlorobacter sp. TaxID=2911007 RepID=UPI00256A51D8|nr:ABC transporter transmembrane domain-containing protein [Trichlorobacter sp.]MDK9716595.1 ABC transporter transmembrane domain-containing protein [Trichlorobacter sp.]